MNSKHRNLVVSDTFKGTPSLPLDGQGNKDTRLTHTSWQNVFFAGNNKAIFPPYMNLDLPLYVQNSLWTSYFGLQPLLRGRKE